MPTTFLKITLGYVMMECATYVAFLVTGKLPSLSMAYLEQPIIFWSYVVLILLAAFYGRRAHHRIARLARSSLPDTPGSDRLTMMFPAIRVFSDPIRYANRHPRYLNRFAWLMMIFASLVLIRVLFFPESVPAEGGHAQEMLTLLCVPVFCLILLFEEYDRGYLFQLRWLRRLNAKSKAAAAAIHDAEMLRVKNREQEDVMALVAHKFRGSLDRIIYNVDHDNSPWVYREAVNTMRGLLDIFSLISSDTTLLRRKLQEDRDGDTDLEQILIRSMGLALVQLLSRRGSERIQQHLLGFARRQGLVPPTTRLRDWHERHGDLAERLRAEWESSLMDTLPQAELASLRNWISARFFPLQISGFALAPMHFRPYGTTASLLTILLTETLTNLFKYYASDHQGLVTAHCALDTDQMVFNVANPTTPGAAAMVKGSGRGHDFLHLLVEKLGGTVNTRSDADSFGLRLQLPANLFLESTP